MPPAVRALRAAVLLGALAPAGAAAQASAYIPLDDPRLPLLEHLIARGDVADPSPMVRPFRRTDAERALAAADTVGTPSSGPIRELRAAFDVPAGDRWRVAVRAGGQAYSHVRRDLLHPLGADGVRPYGELAGEAVMGPFVLVSRPAAEPSISQTRIGKVRNGTGHRSSGGSASAVAAPATIAISRRRHPQASMIEWARCVGVTVGAWPWMARRATASPTRHG